MAKRQYDNDFGSVTQILAILRKIGLEMWFKWNTAAFCDAESSKGKIIGQQIHDVIENHILGKDAEVKTEYPEEVTNALKSFMLFRKEHPEIALRLAEIPMTSEEWGFNGTLDAVGDRHEKEIIPDWKSGKCFDKRGKRKHKTPPIYDEYKYQVAAYTKAYNEITGKNIEDTIIVTFAKDCVAYGLYEMGKEEIDEHFNDAFLPALKIYNHQNKKGGKKNG